MLHLLIFSWILVDQRIAACVDAITMRQRTLLLIQVEQTRFDLLPQNESPGRRHRRRHARWRTDQCAVSKNRPAWAAPAEAQPHQRCARRWWPWRWALSKSTEGSR